VLTELSDSSNFNSAVLIFGSATVGEFVYVSVESSVRIVAFFLCELLSVVLKHFLYNYFTLNYGLGHFCFIFRKCKMYGVLSVLMHSLPRLGFSVYQRGV
jgi:hypothetical protein